MEHGRAKVTLDGLPFGSYAIGCVHDENGNGTLDTNCWGFRARVSAHQETPGAAWAHPSGRMRDSISRRTARRSRFTSYIEDAVSGETTVGAEVIA
jgi:hypothetical protein